METTTSLQSYKPILNAICQMVLDKAPEGLGGDDRQLLETIVSSEKESTYINLCFERNTPKYRASVDVNINFEGSYGSNYTTDDEGNVWKELEFFVTINAPAYGSALPEVYLKRVQLLGEVSQFAQDLLLTFKQPMYKMFMTASEKAKHEAANKVLELEALCESLVLSNRTRMRVTQEREVVIDDVDAIKSIPDGHEVTVEANDGKQYKFRKAGICACYITRIS